MDFVPPRCPNPLCREHLNPRAGFWRRRGWYQPKCRRTPVPRFRCTSCRRGFSRQTFRHDYYDHRPHDNAPLFLLLASGVGLRQCGRVLDLDPRAVQQKLQKMARTFAGLHANLMPRLPADRSYLLDEEETYETASVRPLTMPVVIEKQVWFVVATAVGSIRRLARPGTARRAWQEHDERHGKRPDQSRHCVRKVLSTLAAVAPTGNVCLYTDKKSSYPTIAREVFGSRLTHRTTSSTVRRDVRNPLFPINTTMAMTRDNCGRLRRRSWLVTKKAERLQCQLQLFTVYRNYVRRRFNRDRATDTPARLLGLVRRQLRSQEVLAWRQDWGRLSIHPTSRTGRLSVEAAA